MNYDKELNENIERNKKYLEEYKTWLEDKGMSEKTIKKYVINADFFANSYLNYYDITKVEDGICDIYGFLDWNIEKSLGMSKNSLENTIAALKSFYRFMVDNNYVDNLEYKKTFNYIKENMNELLKQIDRF